jgi:hypothetical protein
MGRMVIVAYRPKPGMATRLMELMQDHVPILRGEGLATDRPPQMMRAKDGTIIEVFEWASAEAIQRAHTNPAVQAMWGRYAEACDFVPLTSLAECHQMFAEFEPVAG